MTTRYGFYFINAFIDYVILNQVQNDAFFNSLSYQTYQEI